MFEKLNYILKKLQNTAKIKQIIVSKIDSIEQEKASSTPTLY
jgi:hypothetical protein